MIVIVTHATSINWKLYEAPSSTLKQNLIFLKKDFIFIRYYMNWDSKGEYYIYSKWTLINSGKIFTLLSFSIFRYITEIIATIIFLYKYKNTVYIWVDPLNSFAWLVLKKLWRIKKNIFYTPDYSIKRFNNKLLNKIYHLIDRVCVKEADIIWNVSSRINSIRSKMWAWSKSIFMPNVPWNIELNILDLKKNKFSLITLWIIDEQLDHINIFNTICKLKNEFPLLNYKVIWNWPKLEEYKEIVKNLWIEKNVEFLWFLKHEDALKTIASSGIWLALYNWKWWFNHFGDSMKCREYFSLWLPVLTTDTHSTVEDIKEYESWIVIDMGDYTNSIREIIHNYDNYSKNSYSLWNKYSKFYMEEIKKLW